MQKRPEQPFARYAGLRANTVRFDDQEDRDGEDCASKLALEIILNGKIAT